MLVVGIPAFNESANIASLVARSKQYGADVVLVVDDGSDDRTAEFAKGAGAVVIPHYRNLGVGGAVQSIMMATKMLFEESPSEKNVLVTLDGDGQHFPEDVPALLAKLDEGYDVVNGARSKTPSHEFYVRVLNRLASWASRKLTGYAVTDSETGFRAHRSWVVGKLFFRSTDYGWNSEALLQFSKMGVKLTEVPVKTVWGVVSPGHKRRGLKYGLMILVRLILVKHDIFQSPYVADVQVKGVVAAMSQVASPRKAQPVPQMEQVQSA